MGDVGALLGGVRGDVQAPPQPTLALRALTAASAAQRYHACGLSCCLWISERLPRIHAYIRAATVMFEMWCNWKPGLLLLSSVNFENHARGMTPFQRERCLEKRLRTAAPEFIRRQGKTDGVADYVAFKHAARGHTIPLHLPCKQWLTWQVGTVIVVSSRPLPPDTKEVTRS